MLPINKKQESDFNQIADNWMLIFKFPVNVE